MMRKVAFLPLIGLTIAACTNNTLIHSYKPLSADGWNRCDTICFNIPQAEADINGILTIGLRTIANIGMKDVVLAVEQCGETASLYRCDTISYSLTDSEGNALGKGINIHQFESVQLPFQMKKGHGCSVRIHHLMRREVITDITEVGIKIANL